MATVATWKREGAKDVGPKTLYKTKVTEVFQTNDEGPLGQRRETAVGNVYVLCKAATTIVAGQVVYSATMHNSAEVSGTVTAIAATTSKILADTGEFASDAYDLDYLVYINDGDGEGQLNRVHKVLDDDSIECVDKWATALAVGDTYDIFAPFIMSPNTTDGYTGQAIAQTAVTADYYFWGQVKGVGIAKCDASAAAIYPGGKVIPAAVAGLVAGIAATDATDGAGFQRTAVGTGIVDCTGATDIPVPIDINIGC